MRKFTNNIISRRTIWGTSILFSLYINIQASLSFFSESSKDGIPFFESLHFFDWLIGIVMMFGLSWTILIYNLYVVPRMTIKRRCGKELMSVGGSLVLMILILIFHLYLSKLFDLRHFKELNKFALFFGWSVVTFMLVLISRSLLYHQEREEARYEREMLRNEKLKSELNELKSFMNPHFLFNSLNTLNALISIDSEKAVLFSSHLSRLYRYILQSKDKELVTIEDELFFIESYEKLLQIRFSDYFSIDVTYSDAFKEVELPVLALQTLVENAVKHNEISKDYPLVVKIYLEDDYLVVSHVLRERRVISNSMGNGISSLSKRCKIILNRDIIIEKNSNFTVKVPTISD
ncbi:histidine kinase [Halosquirtibacter xylanolyticus]|uniref:sensor histidine kinase n=1 Tax=Halosquirtibacter xylanolyticus TaxID=3374599 RepID=UPI0037496ADA|nr:histidine kinase [Prolixibacteraceae bacterium]